MEGKNPFIGLTVEAAAIIGHDGKVYTLPKPNRHHNIIKHMASELNHPTPIAGEQGFVLSNGDFATRRAAKIFARANGQLLKRASDSDELFSEDVW